VTQLADSLDVTEATVRRALQRLARQGRVIRTYGGATVADGFLPLVVGDPYLDRKRGIGAAAAALVADGSTVALSSGSTVLQVARHLRDRHLTVITNALDVTAVLMDAPGITLIVLGGLVLPEMHSTRGHLTEDALRDLRADTLFMGASAIDLGNGFMTDHVGEIAVDRALRAIVREAVIVADSTKFDRVAPGFMFGFEAVNTLVTDERVRHDLVAAVAATGTRVVIGAEGGATSDS